MLARVIAASLVAVVALAAPASADTTYRGRVAVPLFDPIPACDLVYSRTLGPSTRLAAQIFDITDGDGSFTLGFGRGVYNELADLDIHFVGIDAGGTCAPAAVDHENTFGDEAGALPPVDGLDRRAVVVLYAGLPQTAFTLTVDA